MCCRSHSSGVDVSHMDLRYLSESLQALPESAGSKGKHFYIIFFGAGRARNLNTRPFCGLGIYNGAIIFVSEM